MTAAFTPTPTPGERELVPLSEVAATLGVSGQALWARLERAAIEVCRPRKGRPGESAVYRDDFERLAREEEASAGPVTEEAVRTRAELQETVNRLRAEITRLDGERERLVRHLSLQEQVHRTNQRYIEQLEDRLRAPEVQPGPSRAA